MRLCDRGIGLNGVTDIPDRIQGEVTDCAVSYIGALCDMMIQMELELDHRLDDERLARAVELTFDAEPVLGCRFVKHPKMPYWERLKPDERAGFRPVATMRSTRLSRLNRSMKP